jgi:phosphogluconate 2-dehydrogenase
VFEHEPIAQDNPLLTMDNVILTPHCAAHTPEATRRVQRAALDAVIAVFTGKRPRNLVNPDVWKG